MKILNLYNKFQMKTGIKSAFKEQREKESVICKECNFLDYYWMKLKNSMNVNHVCFRISLKSGTLLENSNYHINISL